MVKELKKICEDKNGFTLLNKVIKLLISRYSKQKRLFSGGLKLIKNNQNIEIFLALDRDNQKT